MNSSRYVPIIVATLVIFFNIIPCISSLPSTSVNSSDEAEDALRRDLQDGELVLGYVAYNQGVPSTVGGMVEGSLEWPDNGQVGSFEDPAGDPPSDADGECLRAQQILLGHELNLLLLRIGLGERNDGDHILAMGGICPDPGSSRRRMLRGEERDAPTDGSFLRRDLRWGFVYRGGFACGWFCSRDNKDARRKLMVHDCNNPANWQDCYITGVEHTIEATIRTEIAPKYPECLGTDPNIDATLTRKTFAEIDQVTCENEGGEVKEFLESFSLADFYIDSDSQVTCNTCNSLDFAKTGGGISIDEAYINANTWQASHGVQVSARAAFGGGYTPGNKPIAFNANKETTFKRDMRTPNRECPGGGPGVGSGGHPNQDGENCRAVGNVLVINRYNQNEPEPNPEGGIITFLFDNPVLFSDVGIIDADGSEHSITFKYNDGTSSTFTYHGFGNNGVQRVICNQAHVTQVDIIFRETAGITEINFCEHCSTVDTILGRRSQLISMEDFEDVLPLKNWYNGRVEDGGPLLTTFLGRYGRGRAEPHKDYMVPADAMSLTISLDVYQIDTWDFSGDTFTIYVGAEPVYLGNLRRHAADGDQFSGSSQNGITFLAKKTMGGELAFNNYGGLQRKSDNIWRVELEVPGGQKSLYGSGKLTLKFHAALNKGVSNEALGIDNIKIVANFDCQSTRQLYLEDFEGTKSDATSGWTNGSQDTTQQTGFSKFLGRYSRDQATSKSWTVPIDADVIEVSVDLYQFDSWDTTDYVRMQVGQELIHFGNLRLRSEGEQTGGITNNGLTWQAKLTGGGHLGFNSRFTDHIIHIDVQVPNDGYAVTRNVDDGNGILSLTLICHTDQGSGDESWGWDNVKISATELCDEDQAV